MNEWQPIETAPKDVMILAWARGWHWGCVEKAYVHSSYNGHANIVCREGPAGAPFRIGDKDGPTHWMPLPKPPETN